MKVKTEPIDEEPVVVQPPKNSDKMWVKVRDISVMYYDKDILASGEKLSDKNVNLAQRILKGKFS